MIFNGISETEDKIQKKFFLEKIDIFCRLVEVFCQKHSLPVLKGKADEKIIGELISYGIINKDDEISELEKALSENFHRLINCTESAVEYKRLMGDLLDKLSNSKRKKYQENSGTDYTLADFFCGAGGLSLGFIQQGFNVKLANDIEDVCIHTYTYNHPEVPSESVVQGDIKQIVIDIDSYIKNGIDIVIGGPPCQGFSEANRQRVIDDPRNELYKYFVKAVEKISPKFVVMENVKGMLKVADQVVEDFGKLKVQGEYSYLVSYQVLNSQYFSVAQSRDRLIYIAVRSDVAECKNITPDKIFSEIKEECNKNKIYNLSYALDDIKPLDAPRIKNINEIDDEHTGKKIDVNEYENNNNEYLDLINMGRKIQFVFNHKARYCSDVNYEIYKRLYPGNDATDEKIRDIMPYAHRNHCFKDKYYKLIADRPCRTITAHLRMDCHSHIHPTQIRSITPREAARIQSFPDDYLFLGPYLKTYMQIGNAVPPVMARTIAKVIKRYL